MFENNTNENGNEIRDWEREFLAGHRWGRLKLWFPENRISLDSEKVTSELAHLKNLWNKVQPLDNSGKDILKSIIALEVCNWNLEKSILSICKAIGEKKSPALPIGHLNSITSERWKNLWAYYLTLRNWLPFDRVNGYELLQDFCDPAKLVRRKIFELLGERSRLKELYVERICLLFEFWLGGYWTERHPQIIAHYAAVRAIEEEILKKDPQSQILKAMKFDGDGRLNPCHHKAFRRYDIIISSIGAGKWRATMPRKGIDGLERAYLLNRYLVAIESWIKGNKENNEQDEDKLFEKIQFVLGEPDDTKIFLASLLISLLRPQQMAAKHLAEKRIKNLMGKK
ncbi:MAG: hypothetical protein ACFE94_04225 [Candidatus Hodarchaeota archaeon]